MSSTRSRLGQSVVVMALAMLVLGSLPAPSAGAQPINDARDVEVKVKDFKFDCATFGGEATTRPSASDDDKTIANCKGGEFDGYSCIDTPTTRECQLTREDTEGPTLNPGQSDITDLAPTDTPASNPTVDQAAGDQSQQVTSNTSNDEQSSDRQPKKGKNKKRGKNGNGRR
jgi:hypothetical protein